MTDGEKRIMSKLAAMTVDNAAAHAEIGKNIDQLRASINELGTKINKLREDHGRRLDALVRKLKRVAFVLDSSRSQN